MPGTTHHLRPVGAIRRWCRHLRRALAPDHGGLSRPLDRARSRALLLTACGLLLATALSGTLALHGIATAAHRLSAAAAHRHRVEAVLLTRAASIGSGPATGRDGYRAEAAWTAPSGRRVTGPVTLTSPTRPGAAVPLWLDDQDRPTSAPPTRTDLIADDVATALCLLTGLALLLGAALKLRLHALDRRAAQSWHTAWARVEPLWTGRPSHPPGPGLST